MSTESHAQLHIHHLPKKAHSHFPLTPLAQPKATINLISTSIDLPSLDFLDNGIKIHGCL